jgi:competence protein ComEC
VSTLAEPTLRPNRATHRPREAARHPNGAELHPGIEPLSLRRAPLLAAALCFALGDCLAQTASRFRPTALLLLGTILLLALTLFSLRRARSRLPRVPILALWVAVGLWSSQIERGQIEPAPDGQAALKPFADGLVRTVQGHIVRIRELPLRATPNPDADREQMQDEATWEEAASPPPPSPSTSTSPPSSSSPPTAPFSFP